MSDTHSIELDRLVAYLDEYLSINSFQDYPGAWNGLQIEGKARVRRIAAAVDSGAASSRAAAERGVDLLLVHHGAFWSSRRPLVGRHLQRIAPLIRQEVSLYSAHLPLDAHAQLGNNAVLLRQMGLTPGGQFGETHGMMIGWYADGDFRREDLLARLEESLDQPVRSSLFFGPDRCTRVGVITGGGGSLIGEARAAGVDFFITGEGAHHTFLDAQELQMNVVYGGHYATETFGVKALATHLQETFGLQWDFLDLPSGL